MKENIKIIETDHAPVAIGAYSQAVIAGDFMYISGQLGLNPETMELSATLVGQAEQAIKNIKAIALSASVDLHNVVKTTVMLTNIMDFSIINNLYEKYFIRNFPARAVVEVSALPKGALVEIDAVVYLK